MVGSAVVAALAVGVLISSVYPGTAAALGALTLIPVVFGVGGIGQQMEQFYWKRVHTLQYGSKGWNWVARLAANPVVRDRICAAASSMSTFQHRLQSVCARPGGLALVTLCLHLPCGLGLALGPSWVARLMRRRALSGLLDRPPPLTQPSIGVL